MKERLILFASIDRNGSQIGWCLNDAGEMTVVRLSRRDADEALFDFTTDFLRALAIGYPSLYSPREPENEFQKGYVNVPLRHWLHKE